MAAMIFSTSAKMSTADLSALTTLALNLATTGLVFALKLVTLLMMESSVSSKLFLEAENSKV